MKTFNRGINILKTKGSVKETQHKSSIHEDQKILVITGTPGVGKTSISKLLASKIGAEVLSIGELVKRENLHLGWDTKRKTLIADLERVSKRIMEIMKSTKKTLIIEGHYAVHVVPPEKVDLVFVLRRDPRELEKTLESRGYAQEKVKENVAAEILDVCLFDAVKICGVEKISEIDVTTKHPDEVLNEILLVLEGRKERKVGIVDWLGTLESEGKLDEYLRDF